MIHAVHECSNAAWRYHRRVGRGAPRHGTAMPAVDRSSNFRAEVEYRMAGRSTDSKVPREMALPLSPSGLALAKARGRCNEDFRILHPRSWGPD